MAAIVTEGRGDEISLRKCPVSKDQRQRATQTTWDALSSGEGVAGAAALRQEGAWEAAQVFGTYGGF